MLWQYSYDETTWTDLPFTGNEFQFTDDFDDLTYFRVILAASENTLAQVAKNGTPDNCDKDYFVTNTVSIECLESCKKPEFEVLSDQNKLICEDSDDLVEWKVRQTNQTKSIDIEWYSKATGENTWTLIAGENGESISLPNPKNTTSYLFLAKNGECVSDSIIFELTMIPIFRFDPIGDIDICEGTDVTFTPNVKTRPLSPITFFWDGVPTTELQHLVSNITEDKTVVFYATDGVCISNEVYANFIVEKEADVTLQPLPAVICEGEKVDLIADAKFSPFNTFKWEKDGVLFNNTDLITSDIPHENTIYKFIVEGNLCPTIEYILGVDVEKKAEMTLQPLPAVVCKGEKVDLVADVQLPSSNAYKWEKNGSLLSDVDLVTTDIPEENATYKFTILGDACPDIEDKMIVEVESMADVTLQPLPAIICEGEKVDLIADAKLTSTNAFKWEKGNDLISDADLSTSDIPTEDATYKFTITGDKCPTIEKELSVKVEKKADVTLEPLPAIICEGTNVDLVADAKLTSANTFKWEKGNDLLTDIGLKTTDIPTEDATYKFTITGEKCPAIEKEVSVKVEKMADVTLQPLPAIICEGEKVDLIADAKLTSTNRFKWEKGNDLISDADLSTSDIPTEDATYKFTITGDKCPAIEKEVSVKVEKKADVTLEPLPAIICEGTDVDLVADAKLTSANTFKWEKGNDLLTDIGLKTTDIPTKDATYKFTITGEKCPAIEKEVSVKVEKIAEVTLQPLPAIICEGEKVDLIADANISSTNRFKWEKGNELITDADLSTSDIPTEDATYKFTITGDKCPAIEKEVSVKVEKKADVTLEPLPAIICEGTDVDLVADVKLTSANTFKWEKGNDLLTDIGLKTTDIPTEDATYKFTITGEKCPAIEKEVSVKVEKIAEVTLQPLPAIICEGEKVDLIADAKHTSTNRFKWEKGNDLISYADLATSVIPTEDATYKFTITGDKCPAIEKEISVKVEKKTELSLSISDTEVCENSSVVLSVNATNAPKLVWKQKNDGESQFSEMAESGDVVNITATKSATFIVESSDELACQSAVSNEVSLFVEEPVSVLLENVPTEVCEGTTVLLNASITENCTSYGWKKNENENFAKNELTAEDALTETTTYEFWAKPLVCPAFSEKFVVDVEHVKNVELTTSESRICKDENVTLATNYPYTEGIVWESKGENESQFSKVDEGVSEIVVSPSDNTTYRVSAISKLGCVENGSEQEIEVTQPVGLSVEDVSICEGDAAHLEAVTERAYDRIEWKIEGDSSVNKVGSFVDLTPESTITYNVVAYSHNCPEEVNATITVAPIPRISSYEELGNHTYQMIVENTNETLYFDYHNGDGKTISNLLENAVVGKFYDVEISDSLGCSSSYQFRVPFVEPEFPIYFYQGDENWQVKNIENYPNSTLYIYDRFGKLLFKEKGNTDGWSGEYNGRRLPSTDYWYILDIPEIDKQYEGHFTLMRR
ncbi:MAG: T9SS type B sorting domain-containing protein [Paludibacteraceae bacterium]|nr:T9SS type B sorting domain-containing protein [Paludibacteraceae bacterium]